MFYSSPEEAIDAFDKAAAAIRGAASSSTDVAPPQGKADPPPPKDPKEKAEKTRVEIAKAAAQKAHKAFDAFQATALAVENNTKTNTYLRQHSPFQSII